MPSPPWRGARAWHLAGLLLLPALVFANSLSGEYHLDDVYRIEDNPQLERVRPVWRHFTDPTTSATLPQLVQYRPLLPLSLSLNRALSDAAGIDLLVGYHLGNLALHLVAVLLLYGLFSELVAHWGAGTASRGSAAHTAFAGALLFAVHPVAGTSVNYLCGRDLLLMLAFLVASLWVYARLRRLGGGAWRWAVCLSCLVLSLCSKTNALVAPLVVLAFEWTCARERWSSPRALARAAPFAAVAAGFWLFTRFVLGFSDASQLIVERASHLEYPLTQLRLHLFHYLRHVVWPFTLRAEAHVEPSTLGDPRVWAGALLVGGSLVWAVRRRRCAPLAAFCVAAYWILPALTSSVLPLRRLATDYRLVPSLAFLCLLMALAGARLTSRRARVALLAAAATWFGGTAASLNRHWLTEESFWLQSVRHGGSALAHTNYGLAVSRRDPALAEEHYRRALELYPGHVWARINLGLLMIASERGAEGLALVEEAARLMPRWGVNHHWLAVARERLGRHEDALAAAERACELEPRNQTYREQRTRLLFAAGFGAQRAGRSARAIELYERHLLADPAAFQTHFNLAYALMEAGEAARAVEHFRRTLELEPGYHEVHRHLATCYGALGDEAAREREEALYRAGG
ncbi:MAG: tetratricopeptide repeat protein [Planctomycetota bacterium]|nr:tetratricopeptide repeat protein [Planctomycetota bacterium]